MRTAYRGIERRLSLCYQILSDSRPQLECTFKSTTDSNLASVAEDSLSISLTMCTVTHRDGRVTQLDQVSPHIARLSSTLADRSFSHQVYIRGPSVRFYVVPDMLAQAPMSVSLSYFLLLLSAISIICNVC